MASKAENGPKRGYQKPREDHVGPSWPSKESGLYSQHLRKAPDDFSREVTPTPFLCFKMPFWKSGPEASTGFLFTNQRHGHPIVLETRVSSPFQMFSCVASRWFRDLGDKKGLHRRAVQTKGAAWPHLIWRLSHLKPTEVTLVVGSIVLG